MLVIRLKPTGRNKQINYRIVVMEKRTKMSGRVNDDLGFCEMTYHPPKVTINKQKLVLWQEKGAVLSEGARKLLPVVNVSPKQSKRGE